MNTEPQQFDLFEERRKAALRWLGDSWLLANPVGKLKVPRRG